MREVLREEVLDSSNRREQQRRTAVESKAALEERQPENAVFLEFEESREFKVKSPSATAAERSAST